MKELTKREDQIMQIVWRLKTAFIRDIIEEFPEPKPHYNTVATIVKILANKKGYLKAELMGNTHQYSPTTDFETYKDGYFEEMKKNYFGNSFPKMLAHFAKKEELTDAEKEELIIIIKSKK